MSDNRKGFVSGYELVFDKVHKYKIIEEIGRGASCLVYSASYTDSIGLLHHVRIKECFPYNEEIVRDTDGTLTASEASEAKFEHAKKMFFAAYEKNVTLKKTLGLMNSTVDSVNLFQRNHTWYSIMTCIEGTDYRKQEEKCLRDVFIRMITLSKIVQKYHESGMLHLDIKPENILVIPETPEHVILFDFDSLLSKEDLRGSQKVRIVFSDGFAAPELVQGKKNKISEASDLYSIGAIVYFKLFGKQPELSDGDVSMEYDFSKMKHADERYQPEFYRRLSMFLHKTIATSVAYRYKNIDEIMEVLRDLVELASIEKLFLYHNFSYHTACFVGRQDEIQQIAKAFERNQIVFLSGIGGIGKTELAKRFAYEKQEDFKKIIFVTFRGSIVQTVCGSDLRINQFDREDEEAEDVFFERKMEMLKKVSTEDDFIILDNFDVESDEYLEKLFECPCKFLVTTREDFRDYNYEQIAIARMHRPDDLIHLFQAYNPIEYEEQEEESIRHIIELAEHHTMTVELIAKYLRTTQEHPSVLLKKMMDKEGITNTEEISVKHRKDKKMRAESINGHLHTLFNLSDFSGGERELMMSLSLLGYVRIRVEKFLEYCDTQTNRKDLEKLIRRGWIEFDRETNKISLHQIILDLVYNHLKPTSESCPHIVAAMTAYARKDTANMTERDVKRRLLDYFVKRIDGADLAFASLLLAYCSKIRNRMYYLNRAEAICRKYESKESCYLMPDICCLKIKIEAACDDLLESELEPEEYFGKKSKTMISLAESALTYEKQLFHEPEHLGRFCIRLAYQLDGAVSHNELFVGVNEDLEAFNSILAYAEGLFKEAEAYLLEADMEVTEKERLFEKIQEFFLEDDYTAMYRSMRYGNRNLEAAYHYQEILKELRKKTENKDCVSIYYTPDFQFRDLAQKAADEGDYEKAIDFYKKEAQEGEAVNASVAGNIAEMYEKMGNTQKAVEILEHILDTDWDNREEAENDGCFSSSCWQLVALLISAGQLKKAQKYLKKLIGYHKKELEAGESADSRFWVVVGNYRLYQLETDTVKKEQYWNTCATYYQEFDDATYRSPFIRDHLTDFVLEYVAKIPSKEQRIAYVSSMIQKWKGSFADDLTQKLLLFILDSCENDQDFVSPYILASVRYADACYFDPEMSETALTYCQKALKVYEENHVQNEYLCNLIHKKIGECCTNLRNYDLDQIEDEKSKCNYYLLAQYDAKGKDTEKALEIWKNAVDDYSYLDNWEMMEQCYQEVFRLLDPVLNQYDYSDMGSCWYLFTGRLRGCNRMKKKTKILELSKKTLKQLVEYHFEVNEEKDSERKTDDFCCKLSKIADSLADAEYSAEAFAVYTLAMIAGLDYVPQKRIFAMYDTYFDGNTDTLFSECRRLLHSQIQEKMVDTVMNMWEKMKPLVSFQDSFSDMAKEIRWFSDTYKHGYIEFKRSR